jgi:gamma-glutamyltranspeptidase/glutathione hydrolase
MKSACRLWCISLLLGYSVFPAFAQRVTQAKNGLVVSAETCASRTGIEILKSGGNAVDAAVAVAFTLAVTHPQAGNLGGGGFMVIRMSDGKTTTIDFREKAPQRAWKDMFLDDGGKYLPSRSREGYWSCGVPGSVAGLMLALEWYGTMDRTKVMRPAIELAEKGFVISEPFARDLRIACARFSQYASTRRVFTKDGNPYDAGAILVQHDLASTLERIALSGKDGFYKGRTAELLVAEMRRGRGLISLGDLSSYRAVERPPVGGTYRGYDIVSMGPPSSGGILLIHLLNLLERYDIAASGFGSTRTVTLMTEAMKLAYADRAEFLGDSDFFPVPVGRLISKSYADERSALIDTNAATPTSIISHGSIPLPEHDQTTHFSVIDRWGNAVSVTTTINDWFGSGIVVDSAGFLLNDEMDDFSAKPDEPNMFGVVGGRANAVQPGKRMLSSMTPTIVAKDGKPYLIVGSPGGSTIITTVLQIILNVIDHKMDLSQAVDAPRIHHQWRPDTLWYEKGGLSDSVIGKLRQRGFTVLERTGHQGNVEAILIDGTNGGYRGVADSRGYGAAVGY